MGADYSFDVKNIDIWAPTFFRHNNSFIATVTSLQVAAIVSKVKSAFKNFCKKICQYWLKKLGIILIYPFGKSIPVENTDEIISTKIQIIDIEILDTQYDPIHFYSTCYFW